MQRVSVLARQLRRSGNAGPARTSAARRGASASAIVCDDFGPPEVLQLKQVTLPPVGPGEVRVRMGAVGINPSDTYMRLGPHGPWAAVPHLLPKPPFTPGKDGAGVIEEVGEGVAGVAVGQRVYTTASVTGTYATHAICQADNVHPLPDECSFAQGACVGIPCATAFHALRFRAKVQPGQRVFIHGASGATGLAAVQLAKAMGCTVVGTAGTDRGAAAVRDAGADQVLNHREEGYLAKAKEFSPAGFDIVLEMAGHKNLVADFQVVGKRGAICVIGSAAQPIPFNPRLMFPPEADVRGVFLPSQSPEERRTTHAELQEAMRRGALRPVVGLELPLAEAAKAHKEISAPSSGGAVGNIVLIP